MRLVDLGATYDTSYFDASLRVVFNRTLLVIIAASFIAFVFEIISGNPRGTIFSFLFILTELFLFYLSSIGKFRWSAFVLCAVMPIAVTLLSLGYSNVQHLSFYISVFALITFFYIDNKYLRNALILIQLLCYSYSIYFQINHDHWFGITFDQTSNMTVALLFILVFISISQVLVAKLRENEILYSNNIRSLEEKTDQLLEANNQLAKFSAAASHDMKTPLRTIHSFVGLIEMRLKKNKLDGMDELISQVKQGAERMNNIIDEALNYNPLNKIENEWELVDLKDIVDNQITALNSNYKDFDIELKSVIPIKSHKAIIQKLISNLIENGLKYNDSKSKEIVINQWLESESIFYSVADNGIGIKKSNHELIFKIYERLDNGLNMEGTGLGLAICKGILSKIGGEIWVDKNYSDGAKFIFSIPKDQFSLIN